MSIHAMGAAIVGIPELEISKDESRQLNDAIKEVIKYHPVAVDPAKIAIFQLITVAGGIYGSHIIKWRRRVAAAGGGGPVAALPPRPRSTPAPVAQVPSQMWPQDALMPE